MDGLLQRIALAFDRSAGFRGGGGLLERLTRNNQYNGGHHHKGWGDDAYSDGNIFVAWEPAMYRNAILRTVRGGQVIDHEYNLDWLNRRAIHAASYPFLSSPDAYRDCECCPEPRGAAVGSECLLILCTEK